MRRFSTLDIYFQSGSQRASYWSAPHESHFLRWAAMTAPDTSVHHVKVTLTVWHFSTRGRGSTQGMKVNQNSPAVCLYVHSFTSIIMTTGLSFKPLPFHRVLTSSRGCLKGDRFRFRFRSGRYFVKTIQMNPNVFLNKWSGYYGAGRWKQQSFPFTPGVQINGVKEQNVSQTSTPTKQLCILNKRVLRNRQKNSTKLNQRFKTHFTNWSFWVWYDFIVLLLLF